MLITAMISACVKITDILGGSLQYTVSQKNDTDVSHYNFVDDSSNTTAIFCQTLLKLVDECGRYGKPNQCYFWYTA